NEATLINSRLEESGVAPAAKAEAAEASVAYDSASGGGYSETNTQVSGVDEADIVKTDGEYIYYIANSNVYIVDAKDPSKLIMSEKLNFQQDIIDSKTNMSGSGFNPSEMYIDKNTLTIIGSFYEFQDVVPMPMPKMMVANPFSNKVKVMVYDISNKSNITKTKDFYIDGNYSSSRKINNNLYLISNNYIYDRVGDGPIILPSSFDSADGQKTELDYNRMYYPPEVNTSNLLSITSIDVNNPSENASIQTFLGSSENVYCSNENLYIAVSEYPTENSQQTKIFKFALNNGNVTLAGQGSVEGRVLNQFSMDEYDNYFRIATTNDNWTDSTNNSENNIFILNQGLEVTGKLTGLAKGEQIKSARFMGDKIYLVTFETVDPLFVIDASDPTNPTVLGELKIPGYSTYLHPYDEGHLIGFGFDTKVETYQGNEIVRNTGLKMSLYDVSDINNPKELFSEIIGDEGTYSEILHNHKSLMFDKQRGLIAFPITVVKQREEVIDGATYFGNYQFNGALVYNISLQGFSLKSQISHVQKASDYDYSINRIIYIDNSLFTLSPGKILASDLNSGNELSSLTIGIQ
ncbi:MAG: beta-propeller domain-containing protein, partial [Clostridiales bacterium]|nr:beta-propeller domain-containing protein [Clostridiales bacterium]